MTRARAVRLTLLAAAGAAALVLVGVTSSREESVDLLPNLDQAAPGELRGRTEEAPRRRFYLGFESAAGNIGEGPLVLLGSRARRQQPRMKLVQEVRRSDGGAYTVGVPAALRYVRSPTHSHWHLLGFMTYELRPTEGGRAVRDRKTGFCLGDRHRLGLPLAHARRSAEYTDECGKNRPDLLTLRSGISVGFGDDYAPNLEGQEFDVTDLPTGRYLLVHRVNPQRVLRESDYSDNAASLAFRLSWPRGRSMPPQVDVVGRCPDTETCG